MDILLRLRPSLALTCKVTSAAEWWPILHRRKERTFRSVHKAVSDLRRIREASSPLPTRTVLTVPVHHHGPPLDTIITEEVAASSLSFACKHSVFSHLLRKPLRDAESWSRSISFPPLGANLPGKAWDGRGGGWVHAAPFASPPATLSAGRPSSCTPPRPLLLTTTPQHTPSRRRRRRSGKKIWAALGKEVVVGQKEKEKVHSVHVRPFRRQLLRRRRRRGCASQRAVLCDGRRCAHGPLLRVEVHQLPYRQPARQDRQRRGEHAAVVPLQPVCADPEPDTGCGRLRRVPAWKR